MMIGIDYRQAYLKSDDEESDLDLEDDNHNNNNNNNDHSSHGGSPCRQRRHPHRHRGGIMMNSNNSSHSQGSPHKSDRKGSLRLERPGGGGLGLRLEKSGSFRLEKSGSFRLERSGSFRLFQRNSNHNSSNHGSKSGDDSSRSSRSIMSNTTGDYTNNDDNDDDDDASVSLSSMNWGNISVSDMAMSVASFAASFTSTSSPVNNMMMMAANAEPEAAVVKLLNQLRDRIDSRRERRVEYKKRYDSCLQLAIARYEAGSSNTAALVAMRRVHKIQDGLDRLTDAERQLNDLYGQVYAELQKARLSDDTLDGSPVWVDVDLEHIRTTARTVEETIIARPFIEKTDAQLLEDLMKMAPVRDEQRRRAKARKGPRGTTQRRRGTRPAKILQC